MNDWKELEDFAMEILAKDNPVKPAGSGSTKKEEDVVSNDVIVQCKYTQNKNMTILSKDLERLMDASRLLNKFPLFINSNLTDIIISLPVEKDDTEFLGLLVKIILIYKKYYRLLDTIGSATNTKTLDRCSKELKLYDNIFKSLMLKLNGYSNTLDISLKAKFDDLTICNLFEGENDGVK